MNFIFLVIPYSNCYFLSFFCYYTCFLTWFSLFSQLFSLLLDCLTFHFSFSPLLHVTDDELSMLYRAFVLVAIFLGGNKKGGKLSRGNYVQTICLGFIIQGQFSGWQQFGGNYQRSIILGGNYLGEQLSGGNFLGGNCLENNYPGGKPCSR